MHFSWMLFIAWLNRFMSPDRIFCKSLSESKFIGYLPNVDRVIPKPKTWRVRCFRPCPSVCWNKSTLKQKTNKQEHKQQQATQQPNQQSTTNFFYSESCSLFSCRPKSIWWQFTIAIFFIRTCVHKQLTHNFSIFSFACDHRCMNRNFGSPPNGVISYQGFMTKRGANYKTWRKRYFILIPDGFLIYFKDADDLHHPLGIMYVLSYHFFNQTLALFFVAIIFFRRFEIKSFFSRKQNSCVFRAHFFLNDNRRK